MSLFDETEDILQLYMYATGHNEIPKTYHRWTCLTLVAACLADRVWYQKQGYSPLYPHMYTFLIGPSGLGKGGAIDFGLKFVNDRMNLYYGSATSKSLIDRMATPADEGAISNSKIFLVNGELSNEVGSGGVADAFVKAMTAWYGTSAEKTEESTRTHGKRVIDGTICINWLAGTTEAWLLTSVDYRAMMSGFFGRVCTVPGFYDFNNRIPKPTVPLDYKEVVRYLKDRFEELTYLEGEFTMSPAADEINEEWYMTRPPPEEEDMAPFWQREPALILKLSMILSACERLDRLILPKHVVMAQNLIDEVRDYMPKVTQSASRGAIAGTIDRTRNKILKNAHGISRSKLLKYVSKWGTKAKELDEVLKQLISQDEIEMTSDGRTIIYIAKRQQIIDWQGLS